ncbi:MAG: NUDIX domain-containing protein [Candidatus Thorarchaeota archaeon]
MNQRLIRPKAICVIRNDSRILVEYARWPTEKDIFYIPLGGQIQYGEYGKDTIQREVKEEIGAKIENIRFLGTIENIYELFDTEDDIGHEIVLVFEADFADKSFYSREVIEGLETETDPPLPIQAYWKTLEDIDREGLPLYPDRLRELLGE